MHIKLMFLQIFTGVHKIGTVKSAKIVEFELNMSRIERNVARRFPARSSRLPIWHLRTWLTLHHSAFLSTYTYVHSHDAPSQGLVLVNIYQLKLWSCRDQYFLPCVIDCCAQNVNQIPHLTSTGTLPRTDPPPPSLLFEDSALEIKY